MPSNQSARKCRHRRMSQLGLGWLPDSLQVLRSLKDLERINEKPAAEFWKDMP